MLDSTEIFRSGSMLIIAFFIIVIAKKLSSYFKSSSNELNDISNSHYWSDLDILLKTYSCNVCNAFLTGNYGKKCDHCGICCHDVCIKIAEKNQKCKEVYILNEEQREKHHWVKDGNLHFDYTEDSDIICYICKEECHETENSISQCCWCQRIKHSYCNLDSFSDKCDFGTFRKFIIPPFCVTPSKSSRLQRKFKVKSLSHPGWNDWSPVIVIANRKAGNSDGARILAYFRRLLNPCQVLDLAVHSPLLIVNWCSVMLSGVQICILVAGGDGTVAWILSTINKSADKLSTIPPVGIIPLGTGNDLSRILGWGKEYNERHGISLYFNKLSCSKIVDLDRWMITIKPKNISIRKTTALYFYNYFSIGVDAKVAFDFHQTRQTSSLYMSNRLYNKLLYTFFGTRQAVISDCNGLQNQLELYLDGNKISNIPDIESIVIVNIPSWAAGVKLWKCNENSDLLSSQHIDDGKLETVGIYSSFHIAQLQIGLSEPYYIGQASEIKILLLNSVPIQIDGEPWIQQPAEITIYLCNKAKVLKII